MESYFPVPGLLIAAAAVVYTWYVCPGTRQCYFRMYTGLSSSSWRLREYLFYNIPVYVLGYTVFDAYSKNVKNA